MLMFTIDHPSLYPFLPETFFFPLFPRNGVAEEAKFRDCFQELPVNNR